MSIGNIIIRLAFISLYHAYICRCIPFSVQRSGIACTALQCRCIACMSIGNIIIRLAFISLYHAYICRCIPFSVQRSGIACTALQCRCIVALSLHTAKQRPRKKKGLKSSFELLAFFEYVYSTFCGIFFDFFFFGCISSRKFFQ